MGRPGSALDNAVIESWHSTLEFELRLDGSWAGMGLPAVLGLRLPGQFLAAAAGVHRFAA
jgi:hypothetical protein